MQTLRPAIAVAVSIGLALGITALSVTLQSRTAPELVDQNDESRVVAVLQTKAQALPDDLRALLKAVRAQPGDLPAAQKAARRLIDTGRALGDSRLVGASLGILRPFMEKPTAQTLYLSATARQYQHDFNGALALLDQAIALDPRDANSLLSRATIRIVLGQFDIAAKDCQALHALSRPDLGFLCQATALILTADAPAVYDRLQAITSAKGVLDPALRGWAIGLMGEIAGLRGNDDDAQRLLAQVVAADPLALRERLLLVDLFLRQQKPQQALDLLVGTPEVDGVLIRRVLAAQALGDSAGAASDSAELARRFKLNIDLGLTAHAREETRYFLEIAHDPAVALERAKINWALQHEIEDAQLLINAAAYGGQPQAAKPVLDWMAQQRIMVPTLLIPEAVRKAAE